MLLKAKQMKSGSLACLHPRKVLFVVVVVVFFLLKLVVSFLSMFRWCVIFPLRHDALTGRSVLVFGMILCGKLKINEWSPMPGLEPECHQQWRDSLTTSPPPHAWLKRVIYHADYFN